MFYFFIIISFFTMITLVVFSILYINKLEVKIDGLIDSFDEMDIVDVSAKDKRVNYTQKRAKGRKKQ